MQANIHRLDLFLAACFGFLVTRNTLLRESDRALLYLLLAYVPRPVCFVH